MRIPLTDINIRIFSKIQRFVYNLYENGQSLENIKKNFNDLFGNENVELNFDFEERTITLNNIGSYGFKNNQCFCLDIHLDRKIDKCVDYRLIYSLLLDEETPFTHQNIFKIEYV